jgi:hypothetical protein
MGEFGERKDGEHDAAQFEDRELAVIHYLRPAHAPVEVTKSIEVAGAESDQVGEREWGSHLFTTGASADDVELASCGPSCGGSAATGTPVRIALPPCHPAT